MKLCKDCNVNEKVWGRSYCKECYHNRFHHIQAKYAPQRRAYMENNRNYVHRYKQICGCKKCNEKKYWILDLHHLDPEQKEFDFQTGVSRNRKTLKNEMRKCIVLCKNCHYDFHHLEKNKGMTLDNFLNNPI